MNEQYAYIIDLYNPYNRKQCEQAVFKYKIRNAWWAIFRVLLNWGEPILDAWPANMSEYTSFHIYGTKQEAIDFLHELKRLEGLKK